jgi:hypothetical protein
MTNVPDSGEPPADRPAPIKRPKRGAFPTPKSEIERAKPYIPEAGEEEDSLEREEEAAPEGKSDLPTDVAGEKEG